MINRLLLTVVMLVLASAAIARPAPTDFAWQPHPGGDVPLDLPFVDVAGQRTSLRSLGGVPIILTLGYFTCPTLCGPVRDDLIAALAASGLEGGRDYRVAVLSIDDKETIADAVKAKLADLNQPVIPARAGPTSSVPQPRSPQRSAFPIGGTPICSNSATRPASSYSRRPARSPPISRASATPVPRCETPSNRPVPSRSPLSRRPSSYSASTTTPRPGKYTLEIYKVLRIMAVMTLIGIAGLWTVLQRRQRVR